MKYFMTGRVIPERCAVDVTPFFRNIPKIGTLTFRCNASQINVVLDETELEEKTAVIFVKDFTSTVISTLGFILGNGYDSEITQVFSEKGQNNVYGVSIPGLEFEEDPTLFNNYLVGTFGDIFLRYAIRDYLKAFTKELECPFLCYKAVETIKSSFEFRFQTNDPWSKMHELLKTNADEIKSIIKPFADALRHGSYHNPILNTTSEDRVKILSLTKSILKKYFDYLVREALIPLDLLK